jgi:hypothetical protein
MSPEHCRTVCWDQTLAGRMVMYNFYLSWNTVEGRIASESLNLHAVLEASREVEEKKRENKTLPSSFLSPLRLSNFPSR